MARILAIADEVDAALYGDGARGLEPDIIIACGDLPLDYLEHVTTMVAAPLVFVPGNHDPDLRSAPDSMHPGDLTRPLFSRGLGREPGGPPGCLNVDSRIMDVAGFRIAGLGGSMRYKPGPNQYTEAEMRRRARWLEVRGRYLQWRDRKGLDVLVTHAPPLGVGDGDDPPHRGFASFHRLVARLAPKLLVHGHVHPYGRVVPRHRLDETQVVNVVGRTMLEIAF